MKKNKDKNLITILGTQYEIIVCSQDDINIDNPRQKPSDNALNCWGLCETEKKKIYIDEELLASKKSFNRVLRHEILHAFAMESGLNNESLWGQNEECIDYYAHQFPKMIELFDELGIGGE